MTKEIVKRAFGPVAGVHPGAAEANVTSEQAPRQTSAAGEGDASAASEAVAAESDAAASKVAAAPERHAPAGSEPPQPYAEFGGLAGSLQQREQTASQRREEAMRAWERMLDGQQSARMALVAGQRPRDTTAKRRNLRSLAIGQAVGEFLGALFGGVAGLGRSGRGYVPKMPGFYRKTLEREQRLREHDILANEKFRNLMGRMMEQDAAGMASVAKERYQNAFAEEKRLRTSRDRVELEAARAAERWALDDKKDADRRALQGARHRNRMTEITHAVQEKAEAKRGTPEDAAVDYVTKLLLPKTRTSKTSGGRFETTTVRDATSYSEPEVAAARALARKIAPIAVRHGLSDKQILGLQRAIENASDRRSNWANIDAALKRPGVTVDGIIERINENR